VTVTPRALFRIVLPPLLLAGLLTLLAYAATGATLGLFFAGVVVATLLTPPLVLTESTRLGQLLCAAAIVDGIAVAWLIALAHPSIGLVDWFRAYVVLAGYALALWGLTALIRRLRLSVPLSAAAVTTLALCWLSWPVWLSPWIAGRERLVGLLTGAHPLLALDSVFRELGAPWSERYYMYNVLSVLNQDVAYELPGSVLPAVLLHGLVGGAALLLAGRRRRAVGLEVDVPDGGGGGTGEQHVGKDLAP
jgi:hypothetical protein